jgi:hypothetical protein
MGAPLPAHDNRVPPWRASRRLNMEWKDVGKTVAKAAPILGAVLGGPVGAVAGAAGSLLGGLFGCEADPSEILRAVQADPEAAVKLKEMEIKYRTTLLDWRARQLEAELENTKSARRAEVDKALAGYGGAWATPAVALIVTCGFFYMLRVLLSGQAGTDNQAALILLGSLGTGFGAVVNYYLGSSLGSSQKTSLLKGADRP